MCRLFYQQIHLSAHVSHLCYCQQTMLFPFLIFFTFSLAEMNLLVRPDKGTRLMRESMKQQKEGKNKVIDPMGIKPTTSRSLNVPATTVLQMLNIFGFEYFKVILTHSISWMTIAFGMIQSIPHGWGGQHSTELAYALLTQPAQVWVPAFPIFYSGKNNSPNFLMS